MAKKAKPAARKAVAAWRNQAKRSVKRMNAVKPEKAAEGEKAAALAGAKAKQAVRGKVRDRTLKSALGAAVRNDKRRRGLGTEGLPPEVKSQLAKRIAPELAAGLLGMAVADRLQQP